ncbi:MAG: hypothetical protein A2268_13200 [Candidatus Raymondbacteria bacterium RifOxyA12_full_50_37]|uniref:Polymerase nucleotidyl transferase domain-containing protein n=1 Tax=Candidatus Raymondbacteria bacterium RIFOXYD12_FULL_49_13 TaxID=1817890 RepID=A0A1F7EZZ9_UNCRA|nr:MAG: hypothetical protein A2268_13200 [Candidatus Raymondbacteria bacterium RifOxyA12_full_50_37]OGJ93018.1 MAG: hypothetical protein A2248_18335 [Candidatus Raymondbacteria bacterium RIFOXYA2_FULL_49_16]OGJ93590.1 MAG: hypothetical protein A2350_19090 [Candidatus Raymondbacteria bacterium RifOxyB12_full_50_8]OGJ99931.1 MAG: hypothetical protein A2519_00315 [Candidatus Raymondbacteria bacterium RIFOXYD12_FULL_49_13]OGK01559.1 MAG: hypothetical protein A2487_15565 [Candidatus Raymondbacteria 
METTIKPGRIPAWKPVNDGLDSQYRKAWKTAFSAVKTLRKRFKTGEIRIGGSLLKRDRFYEGSDIDIIVPEFTMSNKMDAEKMLDGLFPPPTIDIVPLKSMPPAKAAYFLERSVPIES